MVPQITQQIVATEPTTAVKPVPPPGPETTATGPTLGAAPNLRRAPTVGYRWSIN